MFKFMPTTRQLRVFIMVVPLSLILAMPLLVQPLGLSDAWNDDKLTDVTEPLPIPPVDESSVQVTNPYTSSFVFDDYGDMQDLLLSRGTTPFETSADPSVDDPIEPSESLVIVEEPSETTVVLEEPVETTVVEAVILNTDHIRYISAGTVNVRTGSATGFESIGQLSFGDKVTCTGVGNEWIRIDYNGQTAYVFAEFTSESMVFQDVNQTVYVDANTLNLRAGPSTDDSSITQLGRNARLTRTGIGDEWSRVKTSSGQVGYVYSKYLTRNAPVTASSGSSTSGSSGSSSSGATYSGDAGRIVELAQSALGVRYVYGGASMSGFDCSGLVYWSYRQIGISVPRVSSSYRNAGVSVSYDNMQPGDIIGIDHRPNDGITSITHLGIYIGNGYMIHASSSNRKVVKVGVADYMAMARNYKIVSIRRVLK